MPVLHSGYVRLQERQGNDRCHPHMTEQTSDTRFTALYQALKAHTPKVLRDRRLAVPPADSVTVYSRLCGSQLTLDALIENQKVSALGYRVRSCSLGQATTAIVADHAEGLDPATVHHVHAQLQKILSGEATHCDWPELEIFTHIKDSPARHGSVLLPFRALEELFERAKNEPTNGALLKEQSGTTHIKE